MAATTSVPGAWIDDVESRLHDAVAEPASPLSDAALQMMAAGGKRLRSKLVFAAAEAFAPACGHTQLDDRARAAAAIELVHLSSLIHDDVLDAAATRRGVPTVNAKHDDAWAILTGDMVLLRSLTLAAGLGTSFVTVLADAADRICRGQALERGTLFDTGRSPAAYFDAIGSKTAALMEAACRLGALVAGASASRTETVGELGLCLGMAFQILDDIADLVEPAVMLGKRPLQDLREGVYTLPVIATLPDCAELRELLDHHPLSTAEQEAARDLVIANDGDVFSCSIAWSFVARADRLLDDLEREKCDVDLLRGCVDAGIRDALRRYCAESVEQIDVREGADMSGHDGRR